MFVGKYNNSIDKKSRLIIPAKYRYELDGQCILAKGLDGCLSIYTKKSWDEFVTEKLNELPEADANARRLKRYYYANASECDIDNQGRITIPAEYKEYASIDKELITIGCFDKIEVWSKESWEATVDSESLDPAQLACEVNKYNKL